MVAVCVQTSWMAQLVCGPMFSGKTTALVWKYTELVVSGRSPVAVSHRADERYGADGAISHTGASVPCVRLAALGDLSVVLRPRRHRPPCEVYASVAGAHGVVSAVLTGTTTEGYQLFASRLSSCWDGGDTTREFVGAFRDVVARFARFAAVGTDDARAALERSAARQPRAPYDTVLVDEAQFFPDLRESVERWLVAGQVGVWVYGLDGDYLGRRFGEVLDIVPLCWRVEKLTGECGRCATTPPSPSTMTLRLTTTHTRTDEALVGVSDYVGVCLACHSALRKTL